METAKPSNAQRGGAASNDASKHERAAPQRLSLGVASRPLRSYVLVLRLGLAVMSLCMMVWILEVDLILQVAQRATKVFPVVAQRMGTKNQTMDNAATSTTLTFPAKTTRTSTQPKQPKLCEKIDMGHIEKEFYRPESCFSRSDIQQTIKGLVWTLAEALAGNDIPYWLDSGTLLGSFREKTVIPYDKDADIGISEVSFVQMRDNKLEFPSEYELHVLGSKLYRPGTRFIGLPARLVHKDSGLYLDIFVFLDDKKDPKMFGPEPSNCFHGCHRCRLLPWGKTEFKIPRDWVYPLQGCAFGGRNVSCPAKPELYLDHLFGPDFMTPDKNSTR